MMNIRDQTGQSKQRIVAISYDQGESWRDVYYDSTLISPVCQASLLSIPLQNGRKGLLFSNPENQMSRTDMTVKFSVDNGATWPIKRKIRSGSSAYSDLVRQDNSHIGLLYEHGNNGGIHYASFNLKWLTGDHSAKEKPWIQKYISPKLIAEQEVRLSTPKLQAPSTIFEKYIDVKITYEYPEATLHYTLNGTPPTKKDRRVLGPISINSSSVLKVVAYHPSIQKSEVASAVFTKVPSISNNIDIVKLETSPSSKYPGLGAEGIFNLKSGTLSFHDKEWMGFDQDSIVISINLKNEQLIKSISIHSLRDQGAWIFFPSKIKISSDFHTEQHEIQGNSSKGTLLAEFLTLEMKEKRKLKDFKLTIFPLANIPDWHPGKGSRAWTFIDEILIEY